MATGNNKGAQGNDANTVDKSTGAMEVLTDEQIKALSSIVPNIADSELREIDSYEDAVRLAEQIHGSVDDIAKELGTGFAILEDKDKLVDTEFVVVTFRLNSGDYGVFMSVAVVTRGGDKFIMNDGSAGIMKQLMEWAQEKRKFGGLKVPNGLRKSDYDTCPACDKPRSTQEETCPHFGCGDTQVSRHKGISYYLDTGAEKK